MGCVVFVAEIYLESDKLKTTINPLMVDGAGHLKKRTNMIGSFLQGPFEIL
jgi:hypothetical protein